jgi:hypothetical protein
MRGMRWLRVALSAGFVVTFISTSRAAVEPALGEASARPEKRRSFSVGIAVASSTAARPAAGMVAEADAIWRAYGITVLLLPARAREIAPCDIRLTLTFTSAQVRGTGADHPSPTRLGSIWFDEGMPSRAIVIDADAIAARVLEVASSERPLDKWPPGLAALVTSRALGRVLAHEIGHYLLASPAHSPAGLMRPAFDGRQLADWDRRGFQLDTQWLPRLRARVARLASFPQEPLVATDQPAATRPH